MKPASGQKPGGQFIQTAMLVMMLFLGYQLFFGPKQQADKRTPDQIRTAIDQNAALIRQKSSSENKPIKQVLQEIPNSGDMDLMTAHPTLSPDDMYHQMLLQNEFVLDSRIVAINSAYAGKLQDLVKQKQFAQADALEKELAGDVLVADTQLRSAEQRNDVQRIIAAQDLTTHLAREYDRKPELWEKPFQVAPIASFPDTTVTLHSLHDRVASLAESLGKNTPVWGFFPGFQLIDGLVHLTGANPAFSYAFAALLLAICVRAIIWPLSQRQMMWSRQMSQLTPLVNEIKNEYKGKSDPAATTEMNSKVMGLYKEYGINPMAGCFPSLLQLPLFLIVYQSMQHYRFEFQHGFFFWINPTTSAAMPNFIARNLGEKDYILIIIYGITFLVSSVLMPVSDPANAKQARITSVSMSLLFAVMMFFWPVPSAFVLYWVFTNVLATAQSLRAYRLPLPPLVKKNSVTGGVYPTNGSGNGITNGKASSTGVPQRFKSKKKKK